MPARNEALGILSYLGSLQFELAEFSPKFIVVDDASTDGTEFVLQQKEYEGFPIEVLRNTRNLGHGPSTLRALARGLDADPTLLVATDADGEFTADDVRRVVAALADPHLDMVEGIRPVKRSSLYRTSISVITRILVLLRTGQLPQDANTPLRAYRPEWLRRTLSILPGEALTPNLLICVYARLTKAHVLELETKWNAERDAQAKSWGAISKLLPSKKFVAFCFRAGIEWISISPKIANVKKDL